MSKKFDPKRTKIPASNADKVLVFIAATEGRFVADRLEASLATVTGWTADQTKRAIKSALKKGWIGRTTKAASKAQAA